MKVVITGGTGLIGSRLAETLRNRGDEVLIVSRNGEPDGVIGWDPKDTDSLDLPRGTDAVVHLAGAPLFGKRWSQSYKEEIRISRTRGTQTVLNAVRKYQGNLQNLISSSAVGYYGDRGDEILNEQSDPGSAYLADVCVDWEQAVWTFAEKTILGSGPAISTIRTGVVLSTEGGALARMLNPFSFVKPFHWGLGGRLGDGQQYMPWIHIEDEVNAIIHVMDNELTGPFNLSAPNPVRNKDFTKALGDVLDRPTKFPIPKFAMKLLYGEAAEVLFASQRVVPEALERTGFRFDHPEIKPALENLLESHAEQSAQSTA